jgi:hypothetical protein
MAFRTQFIPSFDHLSDEDLARELHCWQHCALVSFRTQRQVAALRVKLLLDEARRRETARALAGGPVPGVMTGTVSDRSLRQS